MGLRPRWVGRGSKGLTDKSFEGPASRTHPLGCEQRRKIGKNLLCLLQIPCGLERQ